MRTTAVLTSLLFLALTSVGPAAQTPDAPLAFGQPVRQYTLIIANGTVYDGSGTPGRRADIGIRGDRIATVGDLRGATSMGRIDATGLAVAPGFINMLSW